MSQSLNLSFKGINTNSNDLANGEGKLLVAKNCVVNADNIIEPRRGFSLYDYAFGTGSDRLSKVFFFGSNKIIHYGTTLDYSSGGAFTHYSGAYTAPTSFKMQATEANKNFYFLTAEGVKKIDSVSQTPESCGVPEAINFEPSIVSGSSHTQDNQWNYRILWGIKDENNNYIYGAASQVQSVTNSAGAGSKSVQLVIYIPSGITTSHFYQVYRSKGSALATVTASEELGLVYEDNPTSGEISAGYLTITDITTDELRGQTCYVSPSQQGIVQNNNRPPLAKTVTTFKQCMFLGNTTSKHRYTLKLLGTGVSGTALQVNDTLTIGSYTYTAKSTETPASRQFKVYTGGTVSTDIRDTAVSLCKVINYDSSQTVYATYTSGINDLPGQITLEERSIGGSAFTISASRTTCWSPSSIPTSGTTETSTNDTFLNGLYYSKQGQPEAFPILNYLRVGSANKQILALVPLKDALFIFKEDGVYRLTGDAPGAFNVDLLDDTAILIGPETAVKLSNQIYALTTQGVVIVSDAGVNVISGPIDNQLKGLYGACLSELRSYAFAVGYETEHKYILFTPTAAGDTSCSEAFVWDTFTSVWTKWEKGVTCGAIDPSTDLLYLGDADSDYIFKERKEYDYTDYADWSSEQTISSVPSTTTLVVTGTDTISAGDLLWQGTTDFAWVQSVDSVTGIVTTTSEHGLSAATVTVYKGIDCSIGWVANVAGNPGALKNFQEVALLYKQNMIGSATATFTSDIAPAEVDVDIASTGSLGLWGIAPWGDFAFGGDNQQTPSRILVPRQVKRCSQLFFTLSSSWAYSNWALAGISVTYGHGSTRIDLRE